MQKIIGRICPTRYPCATLLLSNDLELLLTYNTNQIREVVSPQGSVNGHRQLAAGNWLQDCLGPRRRHLAERDRGKGLRRKCSGVESGNGGAADGDEVDLAGGLGLVVPHEIASRERILGV